MSVNHLLWSKQMNEPGFLSLSLHNHWRRLDGSCTCVLLAVVTSSGGFAQHQHYFTGCGDFAPKQPTSRKRRFGPKDLSTWSITNLLQVFYGHLVEWDNKNRTYCLSNLFFLSTFVQIIPLRRRHNIFFPPLPRTSSCKTQHTAPPLLSPPAVTVHQPPHLMMMMSWPHSDSATSQLEEEEERKKKHVKMEEKRGKKHKMRRGGALDEVGLLGY